jgi:hypothetical protein
MQLEEIGGTFNWKFENVKHKILASSYLENSANFKWNRFSQIAAAKDHENS